MFFTVSTSLLLIVIGLIFYLGRIVPFAGFKTMTEEERSRYNVNKITAFLGLFFMLMSYFAFLTMFWPSFLLIFLMAFWIMMVYIVIEGGFVDNTWERV